MKITGRIRIQDGSIIYQDDFIDRVKKLKSNVEIEGAEGEISIDMNEKSTRWHQHKYYRGYVLPPIAVNAFDGRIRHAHFEMKKQFLYYPITCIEEIPEKHFSRCIIDSKTITKDGAIISSISGYIPSMAIISTQEAAEFIQKCEMFLIDFLQGSIDQDGMTYRGKALMIEGEKINAKQGRKKNVPDVQTDKGQFSI